MNKRVILCPNPDRDLGLAATREAKKLLEDAGLAVSICPELLNGSVWPDAPGLEATPLADALPDAVMAVSLGGDGTIMHTARRLIGCEIPILGVNLGTVGFLAELERSELEKLVSAADGQFAPSPRMMLEVTVERDGAAVFSNYALNDVALHGIAQSIHIIARGDGHKILEFSGDGVVLSSPTGSTAYSLSAGGPIVEPTAENIILTPICAHALAARSFVLAPDREVTVEVSDLRCRAFISVDGGEFEVLSGDRMIVKKAKYHTLIAHVSKKTFYDIVYEKLGDAK